MPQGESAIWACVEPARSPQGRPAVRWLACEDWRDAGATLRRLRGSRALHRRRTVALLPRGHYTLRQIDAPDTPRTEWAQAARWLLKDGLDFAVDAAAIDVLQIPPAASHRRPQLLAVAAAHERLRPLVQTAIDAGAPWRALDITETALRNLGALVEPAGRAQALLHFERAHGTLVITAGGELLAVRELDIGLDALSAADPALREPAQDRAVLELQRTLDGFERQFSQVVMARLLVSPGAALEPFIARAREQVFVPVSAFDAAAALDLSALSNVDAELLARALPAIGAALRVDD